MAEEVNAEPLDHMTRKHRWYQIFNRSVNAIRRELDARVHLSDGDDFIVAHILDAVLTSISHGPNSGRDAS